MASLTAAERILQSLAITDPRDIDLEAIAWTQGAIVNYRPLTTCEARIVGTQKKAVISVNSSSTETRQRFSLAHELGHWQYHRGQVLFCDKQAIGNFRTPALNPERHADEFASDLILPNYLLIPSLQKIKMPTLADIKGVAEEFRASLTATLLKTTKSNRFPMGIACYNKAMNRRWYFMSPMIHSFWRPVQQLDPETFAAELLLTGAEQKGPRKMPGEAWFDFQGSDRFEVTEQSFGLPDDEILTVLTLPDAAII
jgi:Zn-dependent peptidase ImmA (M78 family)